MKTPLATTPPAKDAARETTAPVGQGGAGFKAWAPLLITVVVMPALAYTMTSYVLLPKLQQSLGATASAGDTGASTEVAAHSTEKSKPGPSVAKQTAMIQKIMVNVAGSMGTRYLMVSATIAGTRSGFTTQVENHRPQLLDGAAGILSSKTIEDLEKPGARNVIRGELIAVFNGVLGDGFVEDLYLTEFAIQ